MVNMLNFSRLNVERANRELKQSRRGAVYGAVEQLVRHASNTPNTCLRSCDMMLFMMLIAGLCTRRWQGRRIRTLAACDGRLMFFHHLPCLDAVSHSSACSVLGLNL
jgi:hypothetical protein